MNDRLLEILSQREDFNVPKEDRRALEFFSEYLDHGSLFLAEFDPKEDPVFHFTNEARRYSFSLSEIRKYVQQMKSGIPFDWERIEQNVPPPFQGGG